MKQEEEVIPVQKGSSGKIRSCLQRFRSSLSAQDMHMKLQVAFVVARSGGAVQDKLRRLEGSQGQVSAERQCKALVQKRSLTVCTGVLLPWVTNSHDLLSKLGQPLGASGSSSVKWELLPIAASRAMRKED